MKIIVQKSSNRKFTYHGKVVHANQDEVGFSTLPDQVHRKSLKRGFEFTLMVVGESGLGKSTFINSLFLTDLYTRKYIHDPVDIDRTVEIKAQTINLEEKGVRLRLTVVDTPGFGDSINSGNCWEPIVDYIEEQHHKYYVSESGYGIERRRLQDTRVHCCLYFIPPHVRGLRPIDVETMKGLHDRVNIVPVIAKSDGLTKNELKILKANVLNDIEKYEIKIYEFPDADSDDDEEFKRIDEEMKAALPFAIISSNTTIENGDKRIRGRAYPWGLIDVENPDNCDFSRIRTFLCSSHMQDLKDVTNDLYYENFRTTFLKSLSNSMQNLASLQRTNSDVLTPDDSFKKERLIKQRESEIQNMQVLVNTIKKSLTTQNISAASTISAEPLKTSTPTPQQTANSMTSYIKKSSLKASKLLFHSHHLIGSNGHNDRNKNGGLAIIKETLSINEDEFNDTDMFKNSHQIFEYSGTTPI